MKRILVASLLSAMLLIGGTIPSVQANPHGGGPAGHGGHSGWHHSGSGYRGSAWVGDLIAGICIGGILHEVLAPTACVVYPPAACTPQAVYAPPYAMCPPPACYPTVVKCLPQPAVVQQVSPALPVETVWISNSNGSKSPVQLRRAEGGMYVGPRGEYYQVRPNEDQLRQLYGM